MKILYINESREVYERYRSGQIPSHWFYGAIEMEQDGHEVIWCQEKSNIWYDIGLVRKYRPDIIFLPNLNIKNHLLLLLSERLGFIHTPVYAYLHHSPGLKDGMKTLLCRLLLPALKHIFFLSELSMDETINRGFVTKQKCSVPGWGPDCNFYSRVNTSDKGYFVSTGKENRDFDTLIEAFRRTGAHLRIMTAKSHAGQNYEDLSIKCKNIPNIEVVIMENSSSNYPFMLQAMADAQALVCPLRQDALHYCVGLSTIADAEGLHKPLIITHNPYHSSERMKHFDVVTTVEDWVQAIQCLINRDRIDNEQRNRNLDLYSMQSAYNRMKSFMNL